MLKVCRRLTPVAAVVLAMASPSAQRDDTHGRDAVPDYEKVFNQDSVGRLEIRMAASDWEAVVADMDSMAGRFGGAGGSGIALARSGSAAASFPRQALKRSLRVGGRTEGDACSFGTPAVSGRCVQTGNASPLTCVGLPAGGGPGGATLGAESGGAIGGGGFGGNNGQRDDVELLPRTPIYVPVDLTFDGETFRHVGFRLKGNSSLVSTWQRGAEKVPFRLNIDALEERYPEIVNQTFFGFPNLGFQQQHPRQFLPACEGRNRPDAGGWAAGAEDRLHARVSRPRSGTHLPGSLHDDRDSGRADAGHRVWIQRRQSLQASRYRRTLDRASSPTTFPSERMTPIRTGPTSRTRLRRLNDPTSDREVWRRRLEARVDVGVFLRWLALNTLVGNNDAYGGLSAHNYYLYGSPRHRDRLFWIPWDHDLAIPSATGGLGGGGPVGGGGGGQAAALDLFHTRIGADWPLIRRLLDDPVYRATYRGYLEELLNSVLEPARVNAHVRAEYRPHRALRCRGQRRGARTIVRRDRRAVRSGGCRSGGSGRDPSEPYDRRARGIEQHAMTGPTSFRPRAAWPLPLLLLLAVSRPVAAQSTQEEGARQTPVFEVAPRAYVQFDWRGYPEWPIEPGGGRLQFDTFEVRRARIGVDGRWRRLSFEVAVDPQDVDDDTVLKDAYGQFRFSRALRLRVGQFKIPAGREYLYVGPNDRLSRTVGSVEFGRCGSRSRWHAERRDRQAVRVSGGPLRGRRTWTGVACRRDNRRPAHMGSGKGSRRSERVPVWAGRRLTIATRPTGWTAGRPPVTGSSTACTCREGASGLESTRLSRRVRGRSRPRGSVPPTSVSSRVSTSKICRRSSPRDGALRPTTASAGGAAARACVRARSISGCGSIGCLSTTATPQPDAIACGCVRRMYDRGAPAR